LKTNALIFHLELAKITIVGDPRLGMSHLSSALQALDEISGNRDETGMTLEDLDHIHYQATQWRDR